MTTTTMAIVPNPKPKASTDASALRSAKQHSYRGLYSSRHKAARKSRVLKLPALMRHATKRLKGTPEMGGAAFAEYNKSGTFLSISSGPGQLPDPYKSTAPAPYTSAPEPTVETKQFPRRRSS